MRGFYKVALTGAIVGSALSMGTVQASASNVKVHLKTKIGSKVYKLGDVSVKKNKTIKYTSKKLINGYHQSKSISIKANKAKTVYLPYKNTYQVKYYTTIGSKKYTIQTSTYRYNQKVNFKSKKVINGYRQVSNNRFVVKKNVSLKLNYSNKYKVKYYTMLGAKRYDVQTKVYQYNQKVKYKSSKVIAGYRQVKDSQFVVKKDVSVNLPFSNKYLVTINQVSDTGKKIGVVSKSVIYGKKINITAPSVKNQGVLGNSNVYITPKKDTTLTFKYAPYQTLAFTLKNSANSVISNQQVKFKTVGSSVEAATDSKGYVTGKFLRNATYSIQAAGIDANFKYGSDGKAVVSNKTGNLLEGLQVSQNGAVAKTTVDTVVVNKTEVPSYTTQTVSDNQTTVTLPKADLKVTKGSNIVLPATKDNPAGLIGQVVDTSGDGKKVTIKAVPVTDVYSDLKIPSSKNLFANKPVLIHYPTSGSGEEGKIYADDSDKKLIFSIINDDPEYNGGLSLQLKGIKFEDIGGIEGLKLELESQLKTLVSTTGITYENGDLSTITGSLTTKTSWTGDAKFNFDKLEKSLKAGTKGENEEDHNYYIASLESGIGIPGLLVSATAYYHLDMSGKGEMELELGPVKGTYTAGLVNGKATHSHTGFDSLGYTLSGSGDAQLETGAGFDAQIIVATAGGFKHSPGDVYDPTANNLESQNLLTAGLSAIAKIKGTYSGEVKGHFGKNAEAQEDSHDFNKRNVDIGVEFKGRVISNPLAGFGLPVLPLFKEEFTLPQSMVKHWQWPTDEEKNDSNDGTPTDSTPKDGEKGGSNNGITTVPTPQPTPTEPELTGKNLTSDQVNKLQVMMEDYVAKHKLNDVQHSYTTNRYITENRFMMINGYSYALSDNGRIALDRNPYSFNTSDGIDTETIHRTIRPIEVYKDSNNNWGKMDWDNYDNTDEYGPTTIDRTYKRDEYIFADDGRVYVAHIKENQDANQFIGNGSDGNLTDPLVKVQLADQDIQDAYQNALKNVDSTAVTTDDDIKTAIDGLSLAQRMALIIYGARDTKLPLGYGDDLTYNKLHDWTIVNNDANASRPGYSALPYQQSGNRFGILPNASVGGAGFYPSSFIYNDYRVTSYNAQLTSNYDSWDKLPASGSYSLIDVYRKYYMDDNGKKQIDNLANTIYVSNDLNSLATDNGQMNPKH